jgi:DNA-binding response OmpR family regulator
MANNDLTKLLVIDHDSIGDDFVKLILNPAGYDVLTVYSNIEGIKSARNWKPDVIIFNLMLPSSNGWQVCQDIRKFSKVPILILSAVSDPKSIARWLDAGADDYLTKPVSTDVLVAHLHNLTRRTNTNQSFPSISILH